MTERFDEILKKSPFNQHTDEFLIKLEDMNEITKIMKELNESCNYLSFQIGEVVTKNQRYKQALEFYANEKNYERAYDDEVLFDYLPSEIDFDNGEKARKALEREG